LFEQSSGIPAAQVAGRPPRHVASQDSQRRIGLNVLAEGRATPVTLRWRSALRWRDRPQGRKYRGGGFMLVHVADSNENAAIDYRDDGAGRYVG